jgi:hypothetical protein
MNLKKNFSAKTFEKLDLGYFYPIWRKENRSWEKMLLKVIYIK